MPACKEVGRSVIELSGSSAARAAEPRPPATEMTLGPADRHSLLKGPPSAPNGATRPEPQDHLAGHRVRPDPHGDAAASLATMGPRPRELLVGAQTSPASPFAHVDRLAALAGQASIAGGPGHDFTPSENYRNELPIQEGFLVPPAARIVAANALLTRLPFFQPSVMAASRMRRGGCVGLESASERIL